jgi:multidrug efflux system outer membrane protein
LGLSMSWEIDIWKKLRNATQAAALRYMSTIDGRNFTVTQLVAEIANTYFELLSYDKQLEIVNRNIELQTQALELIQLQKEAARVTSLPVLRFQGEVFKNRSRQFELKQKIVETENRINFLVGRLPQPIPRPASNFIDMNPKSVAAGLPSELLKRRPDVRRAELRVEASKLDLKSARARFYPSLTLEAGAGFESFKSQHLFLNPESTFYSAVGGLTAPLLNRMAIKADYFSANSKQIQAVYDYERAILNAYTEVVNHLSLVVNMQTALELKMKQAEALQNAADTSTILYKAARADYVEVLLTRRDALEAQMELIEIKKRQLTAYVNLYKSLGGGWQNETATQDTVAK